MCGVSPRPVDARALQDRVGYAASQCGAQAMADMRVQLDAAAALFTGAAAFGAFKVLFDALRPQAPAAGCLRAPQMDMGCAPTGQGLSKNPAGWPQGSVRTAGGYTIVPEGKDQAWKIYGPQQGPDDKPLSRVWGDPHVDEADGQRWDFTKSSQ